MEKLIKNEKGLAVVEATLLLPFCFIMIIALYYVAIFMCQKIWHTEKQRGRLQRWEAVIRRRQVIIRIHFHTVF